MNYRLSLFLLPLACTLGSFASALQPAPPQASDDWPMWGRDETRNMVSTGASVPGNFAAGDFVGISDEIDMETTENVRWIAKLGSQTYGNPTVANGRVYVGTNNDSPRDARFKGDRGIVYCLDEKTGELLWQFNAPKLGTGKVSDWEYVGVCSSPSIEGERVYFVTNRGEVICLDAAGLANGNDGSFQEEGQYLAGPGGERMELLETDADILWVFNMIEECGVFPHNITTSSVLIAGDLLWVTSANGIDYEHIDTPAPEAPSLIAVNKLTGELVSEEASGLSSRMFHSNWTSPAYLRTAEVEMCIYGGPDGFCYAFAPEPVEDDDGRAVMKELWRFDCNPPEYRVKDGKKITYTNRYGPSEVLATPVTHDGLIYAVIGQDPEHGEGIGNMVCLDPTGKEVWSYNKINRSMSTPAIANGLVFVSDYSGFLYCLDAKTGEEYWIHDTKGHIWSSPLYADGKVYLGNEDGFMTIVPGTKEYDKKNYVEVDMISPIYSSAIAANGVLYVGTPSHLYAFESSKE